MIIVKEDQNKIRSASTEGPFILQEMEKDDFMKGIIKNKFRFLQNIIKLLSSFFSFITCRCDVILESAFS